jgi:hypothetical protein
MEGIVKHVEVDLIYYTFDLGAYSFIAFNPQEIIVKLAELNFSLN